MQYKYYLMLLIRFVLATGLALLPGLFHWKKIIEPRIMASDAELKLNIAVSQCFKTSNDSLFYKSWCDFDSLDQAKKESSTQFCQAASNFATRPSAN